MLPCVQVWVGLVPDFASMKGGIFGTMCLLSSKQWKNFPCQMQMPQNGPHAPLKGSSISPFNWDGLQIFKLKGVNDYVRCPSNDLLLLQRADHE